VLARTRSWLLGCAGTGFARAAGISALGNQALRAKNVQPLSPLGEAVLTVAKA